jgi:hypothetical protein
MKAFGMILVVVGLVGLLWGGITWTQREEVADFGPIEITKDSRKSVPVPPIAGGIALAAGAALLVASGRRS